MVQNFKFKQNDTYGFIDYSLLNSDGTPFVIPSDATVSLYVSDKSYQNLLINKTASIVDYTNGQVSYQLQQGDLISFGDFIGEFRVTFSNGQIKSFPQNGYLILRIDQSINNGESQFLIKVTEIQDFEDSINQTVQDFEDSINGTVNAQISRVDNLIQSTPQPSEVVDARTNASGKVYTVLKSRLDDTDAQLASRAYKRITEFGAISDANYYNSADGNYYVDSSYTTRSTDNTQAFSTALNSGYNIFLMPGQQFYISTGIILNSSIKISGVGAKVYVKSSTQPTYAFYIKGDFTSIEGLSVNSTLDYAPVINGVGKAGKGSNIIAFQVEANYIEINNCKTNNCDYGVARNTMVNCNNLYVDHCSFENAAIGIFAFYITNMFVSNTYVSCNNSGLDIAFHCVYISDYATNVFFDNVKMLWPTDSNGAIIQLYSARSIYAQNVHFTNCEIETYGVIGVNITYCNGLTVSGCKFIMHQLTNETGSKLFFSQGYLSDVTFKNCIVDMYTANVLADGLSTNVVGDINVENCTFNITQTNGTNIVGVVVPVRFIQCNFIIGNFTNGQFLGSASSTPSHIRFINCYFDALQGRLMFGNGDMSIHGIVLINTIIINRGVAYGYVFYNQNDAKFMMCIGNKFYGYNAITSPTDATLNDNILSAIANTYYSQANLP